MPVQSRTYQDVKNLVRPGDVVAFAGDNPLSTAIMKLSKADVSHVGIIVATATAAAEAQFIEATIRLEGSAPTLVARVTPLPDRIGEYHGQVWWLPLSPAVRATFRDQAFATYVHDVVGTPFDLVQGTFGVLKSPFDIHNLPVPVRTGDALFCSELVVEALHAGGVVGEIDPSDVMPGDVCSWRLYDAIYALLKGAANAAIGHYNTRPPGST